jgi:hypothetical protein
MQTYVLHNHTLLNVHIHQMGRTFGILRYTEHIQVIWTSNEKKTGYSHYILNSGHSYDNLKNSTLNYIFNVFTGILLWHRLCSNNAVVIT